MKKTIYLMLLSFLFISFSINAQVTNTVTFVVDMSALVADGFDPASDTLEIAGLDWDDGADVTVTGDRWLEPDPNDANTYTRTLTVATTSALAAGDSLRWKFHGYPENRFDPAWEGGIDATEWDGRSLILEADGTTFNFGPLVPTNGMFVAGISNTVTFKADLTDLFGSGVGFFDPAVDNIEVRGFWGDDGQGWVEAAVIDGSTGPMSRNLDPGVVYETTVTIQLAAGLPVGTETSYKFKTYPDERWADGGWEIGSNTPYAFQEDGASVEVLRVPNVIPKQGPLGQEVEVLFQCLMPENALNRYDSSAIPQDQVEWLILKGDNPAIGLWAGDWVADDTLTAGAVACYDNGTKGDKVAGDNIFSRLVTFADTITAGGVIYKFGAQYPDAGTVSSSGPLDNSRGVGQNFSFNLSAVDTVIELYEVWPTVGGPVGVRELEGQTPSEYTLSQNYPNPFNPTTKIQYSVPEQAQVSLRVYDILGREVAVLVNEVQTSGNYEYKFDASALSSGIYFYKLDAAGLSISRKMILMK